ncbi:MAG: hypothetical protein ING66_07470 [Rhodocyclaceae bacterium]|nr:hypothetical protein [Rhodocyclaceae bacterium]MCA3061710.1 hypothetical protein [Rhodocyclaceae bacterium]MCA3081952.1 hypothetical protein [Rhodocyclaceae bacterium]
MSLGLIAIVAGLALVVGLILYIPGHFLAKRLLRHSPTKSAARLRITRAGFVYFGLMVFALMAGFSLQYLAADTLLGQFVGTGHGLMVIGFGVVAVFSAFEVILRKFGVQMVVRE